MAEVYGNVGGPESQQDHGKFDAVKDKASQAGETAKKKLVEKADAQKDQLVSRIEKIAQQLDEIGNNSEGPEGQIFTRLAGYARQGESMLEGKRVDEIARLAVDELKQRPGLLLAGCFAAGFFGSRLLKTEGR